MKLAILGFGREGRSVLQYLQKRKKGAEKSGGASAKEARDRADEVWVLDKKPQKIPRFSAKSFARKVKSQFGKGYLKNLERFDAVFRSPGVPYNLPELVRARRSGAKFSSATKLFFEHCPTKNIIGVTGTKGKGTAATLIYQILRAARSTKSGPAKKIGVFLAGNIGKPALEILPKLRRGSWVVLELSSFQLQDLKKSPNVAVVLDVFPDHQDSHLSLKEYYGAKANIARHQKKSDKIFYFSAKGGSASGGKNSPKGAAIAKKSRGKKIAVSEHNWKLFAPEDLKIPGRHNFKNAVMAARVTLSLGIPRGIVLKTAKNFRGLEHRLELVRVMRAPRGLTRKNTRTSADKNVSVNQLHYQRKSAAIAFYNDSASTNPHTTAAAIKAFPNQPKILIAGGQDKGLDYKPLARALRGSNTKLAVLCGENKRKIMKAIKGRGSRIKSQIILCEGLRRAVKIAYRSAKKLVAGCQLPVAVIFSPGAASFDQFNDYADRGERFKKIVRSLTQNIN